MSSFQNPTSAVSAACRGWPGGVCRCGFQGVLLGCLLLLSGCSTVLVSATNPVPGLTTVAVAPFFNLSPEPSADGRRVAFAYFAELQKNPGFQVIPVGVVEQAITDNNLSMGSPADVLELARLLNVDAVVVGAITDYRPYYPPQMGLQVQWYSPREWVFFPGIPGGPGGPEADYARTAPLGGPPVANAGTVVRGQSADDRENFDERDSFPTPARSANAIRTVANPASGRGKSAALGPANWPSRRRGEMGAVGLVENTPPPGAVVASGGENRSSTATGDARKMFQATAANGPAENRPPGTLKPLMTYTRLFDGADPDLVTSLKAYVAYRGDLRSGGWEAHLQRSDDFLRFAAHQMIVEMLALHGGALKTESICTWTCWK